MKLRGGEFSTGTMRNFQPELTKIPLCSQCEQASSKKPSKKCNAIEGLQEISHGVRRSESW
jgi:hypothetical protein